MAFRDPFGILSDEDATTVKGLLDRYKSRLSIPEIAQGIQLTLENARALFEDAMLMRQSGRLARSMSLLIAAMEEMGKVSVLASMSRIPKSNQKPWADVWESFRKNQHKSTWSFVSTYPDEARAYPPVLLTAARQQLTLAEICERLRQYGLYVDFHAGEKRWLSPQEVTEAMVEQWQNRAENALVRTEACEALGLFSERALEIQREVYSDFNSKRLTRKDTQPEDLGRAFDEGPGLAVHYFRRLLQERILLADADLSVLGILLTELGHDDNPLEGQG